MAVNSGWKSYHVFFCHYFILKVCVFFSKHGRKGTRRGSPRSRTPEDGDDSAHHQLLMEGPVIKALSLTEGWLQGGQQVIVIGENFFPGLEVYFGSVLAYGDLITNAAMKINTPPRAIPGVVDVTLQYKGRPLSQGQPHRFLYSGNFQSSLGFFFWIVNCWKRVG